MPRPEVGPSLTDFDQCNLQNSGDAAQMAAEGTLMLANAEAESAATAAENWLVRFERALSDPDSGLLKTLFHPDSYWRDVLALTWDIRTVEGLDAILREMREHVGRAKPTGFRIARHRTAWVIS